MGSAAGRLFRLVQPSDGTDGCCLKTLRTLLHVELHLLSLLQGPVTGSLDGGVVHEHISAVLLGDEPVTLLGVEPLHGAGRHGGGPPSLTAITEEGVAVRPTRTAVVPHLNPLGQNATSRISGSHRWTRVPSGPSSTTQPRATSWSRSASAAAKSRALRASSRRCTSSRAAASTFSSSARARNPSAALRARTAAARGAAVAGSPRSRAALASRRASKRTARAPAVSTSLSMRVRKRATTPGSAATPAPTALARRAKESSRLSVSWAPSK